MVAIFSPWRCGEGDQVGQPRHGAVVVHDLADDAGRIKPGKAREIDGRLGMAGADQHAAVLGDQREHMARGHDVAIVLGRIDGDGDGVGAVMRRDAGRDPFPRLDRHGEGGGVARAVRARHQFEMKLLGALRRQREADQPAAVLGHEVDGVGRRHLRRDDEVALVLALLGVDQDEHAAVARILDHLLDGGEELMVLGLADARSRDAAFLLSASARRSAPGDRLQGLPDRRGCGLPMSYAQECKE